MFVQIKLFNSGTQYECRLLICSSLISLLLFSLYLEKIPTDVELKPAPQVPN